MSSPTSKTSRTGALPARENQLPQGEPTCPSAVVARPVRILVGVDAEGGAQDAVAMVLGECAGLPIELHLAHVVEVTRRPWRWTPKVAPAAIADQGRAVIAAVAPHLPAEARVHCVQGYPAQELVALAREVDADLLVLGRHVTGAMDPLIGGTAQRIIRNVPCPVLVHKMTSSSLPRHLLVAVDLSAASRAALRFALGLARAFGRSLEIVHVFEPPDFAYQPGMGPFPIGVVEQARHDEHRALDRLLARIPWHGIPFELTRLEGNPGRMIVEAARERGPCTVVLGTHGRTGFDRLTMGSVAEYVVRRSESSVVISPLRARRR